MTKLSPLMPFWRAPVFVPEDGTGAATNAPPANDAAPAPAPDAGAAPPAAKWFEGERLSDDQRRVLQTKGWAVDDPADAAAKLLEGYQLAEKRLGKPLDTIIDRPAKGQTYSDWAKANADALGLPKELDGYKVEKPADFPKEMLWDDDLAAKAQQLAFDNGVPPDVHKNYVAMFAQHMQAIGADVDQQMARANDELKAELTRDWGKNYDARVTLAGQAMQHFATEAGLSEDSMTNAMAAMTKDMGDAAVVKLFATIGAAMGEDKAINLGSGAAALGMTPAEARAEMKAMTAEGGALYVANDAVRKGEAGATTRLKEAQARQKQLAQIAGGE